MMPMDTQHTGISIQNENEAIQKYGAKVSANQTLNYER